tara:strand:- start:2439 stop:2735 length:297 start_codon:yes stop_codon:yes gene_type:complete
LPHLLHYLFGRGITATNLTLCILKLAKRWDTRLPRQLPPGAVEAILASVPSNLRHGASYYGMDCALCNAVVHLKLTVIEEAGERYPSLGAVANDFGHG